MHAERHVVTVTTDADGDATSYTPVLTGRVLAIVYVKDGSAAYADGVDFTITAEATGQSLWTDTNVNSAETVYPLAAANLGADGAASTLTEVPIALANDRVKIVVASGGDTKVGTFHVIVG
jgi:hypothetical protein